MKVIICIDDNKGMLFNNRRQSRDAKVLEDIVSLTNEVWIDSFSEKLFEGANVKINVDPMFLDKAGTSEFCFVENQKLLPYVDDIEQLIVYKWNRSYPSDFKLDLDLNSWKLVEAVDFAGTSHDTITREIYCKA